VGIGCTSWGPAETTAPGGSQWYGAARDTDLGGPGCPGAGDLPRPARHAPVTAAPGAGRTPTLDGLRGIAVLAVVIEHAWPDVLPGGFAGVDVFFVLSGFLITRMLITEVEQRGTIDLVAFYARRVRRIIPAATLCVVLVTIVFTVVLGVGFRPEFRTEALAAALSVSNFLFVSRTTDYFAADPSSSPFLHYWSLAVEEQFYLVWPTVVILLVVIARRVAARVGAPADSATAAPIVRWLPIGIAALVAAGSLGLTISDRPTTAFFLLPHRAWELLVGGILAWLQVAGAPAIRLPGTRWLLALVGGAALAWTFVSTFERWPGPGTMLPVFGTALLIAGGTAMPGAALLSMGWLRFFGRISYALYLWHWPILAAAALVALPAAEPPLLMTIAAVGLAIGAAIASTLLVEEPIRFTKTSWLSRGRAIAAAGIVLALAGVTIGMSTTVASPGPIASPGGPQPSLSVGTSASPRPGSTGNVIEPPPDIRPQLATIKSDRERLIRDDCYTKLGQTDVRDCVYGAAAHPDGSPVHELPAGMPVAVLFGDSHAMHWFPAVNAWATSEGYALVPLTRSGCVAVDADMATDPENVAGCNTWRTAALARIEALHPVVTAVSSSSGVNISIDGVTIHPRSEFEAWKPPTIRFLQHLATIGGSVLYIGDVPRPGFDVPECLAAHWSDLDVCALPLDEAQPPGLVPAEIAVTTAAQVAFTDPTPWLCPDGRCTWVMDGRIAYVDDHHITASTSLALAPTLAPYLDTASGVQPPP
jgi:peptidoglycan/LPS O-acetylase OafA/YrhL